MEGGIDIHCRLYPNAYAEIFYGAVCVGSAVGGISVGTSVGGSVVIVGARVFIGKGSGVFVGILVGVLVGIAVFVAKLELAAMSEVELVPLTDGFVPQSTIAFIQFITSCCNTLGSQALKKSWCTV